MPDVRAMLDPPPAIVNLHDATPMEDAKHGDLFLTYRELAEVGRFDCKIDRGFLLHTGREIRDELIARSEDADAVAQLPYSSCIFEFDDEIVAADMFITGWGTPLTQAIADGNEPYNSQHWSTGIRGRSIKKTKPASAYFSTEEIIGDNEECHFQIQCGRDWDVEAQFSHCDAEPYETIHIVSGGTDADERRQRTGAELLLGMLCLLDERLVVNTVKQPSSTLTKNARAKARGRNERHSHIVVTLNLAEAKRRSHAVSLRTHESPRLHWRRGHWRTLNRLSEFERRTWVKRCLVGDPANGFVSKHYVAVWQPTVH